MANDDNAIRQSWSPSMVLLSYAISVTGSYCTIQLMERWRRVLDDQGKRIMLLLSSLALGGCGIWCMHFTGMTALTLKLHDGSTLIIDFELTLTVLSFLAAVFGVLMGLKIASLDPYFLEREAERRNRMLASDVARIVRRVRVPKQIKVIALFSRPLMIVLGGAFAALGVLSMHYLGMKAQRTDATMTFDSGLITLSVLIAVITTTTAFWIIFRALTFMPNSETLRLGSALIMGVAVCATHYCGMAAASYSHRFDPKETTGALVNGTQAASAASHISLLVCYWLTIYSVVRNLQKDKVHVQLGPTVLSPRSKIPLPSVETSTFNMKVHVDNIS